MFWGLNRNADRDEETWGVKIKTTYFLTKTQKKLTKQQNLKTNSQGDIEETEHVGLEAQSMDKQVPEMLDLETLTRQKDEHLGTTTRNRWEAGAHCMRETQETGTTDSGNQIKIITSRCKHHRTHKYDKTSTSIRKTKANKGECSWNMLKPCGHSTLSLGRVVKIMYGNILNSF